MITYSTFAVKVQLIPLPWANWNALKNVASIIQQINNKLNELHLTNVKVLSYKVDKDSNTITFTVKRPNISEAGIVSDLAIIALAISVIFASLGFLIKSITTAKVEITQNEIKKKALELYNEGKIDKATFNKILSSTSQKPAGSEIDVLLDAMLIPIVAIIVIELIPQLLKVMKP